jgi:hypothetical protein
MDFTVKCYNKLLESLINKKYSFQSFCDFLNEHKAKVIILRHDVDDRKLHSLQFARIQAELGVKGTYYFRMVSKSYDENVIKEIYNLGHEIGYHYEDLDFANGDKDKAINLFEKHLNQLRELVPISTICMHGSPKSKFDNKDVWMKFNYKDYGIIGEPYFDVDFNQIAYYTDTGRMWDGNKVSIRDKVISKANFPIFHSTQEMIDAIEKDKFPNQAMLNFHPQRWTDDLVLWWKEQLEQKIKNQAKKVILYSRR